MDDTAVLHGIGSGSLLDLECQLLFPVLVRIRKDFSLFLGTRSAAISRDRGRGVGGSFGRVAVHRFIVFMGKDER